jgi:class 3 adenylate cyclase
MSGEPAPLVSGADIRTFLFADMRGYTRYTQEHGDDASSSERLARSRTSIVSVNSSRARPQNCRPQW